MLPRLNASPARLPGDGHTGKLMRPPHARYVRISSGNLAPEASYSLKTRSSEPRGTYFGAIMALDHQAVFIF